MLFDTIIKTLIHYIYNNLKQYIQWQEHFIIIPLQFLKK